MTDAARPMTTNAVVLKRALAFVAKFKGDPCRWLNCLHAEALAAEVHRLRGEIVDMQRLFEDAAETIDDD